MIYPDLQQQLPEQITRVHFVGIGGNGMHGIARMFHERGVAVTGSDRAANPHTQALSELGIKISIGHDASHARGAQTLVVTGALWEDNPEYQYALANNIPVLHRSQALHWLSRNSRVIAFAGAHGKTTSTGMLITALQNLGADPSFVNGGVLSSLGVSAATGAGELFVLEADESDKSFLLYNTEIAVVTNVDPEHLVFYGSEAAFRQAFVDFAAGASGVVVLNSDDAGCAQLLAALPAGKQVLTFGVASDATLRIEELDTTGQVAFTAVYQGQRARVQLGVYGAYNAYNAASALLVLCHLGYGLAEAAVAVQQFSGVGRRFELRGVVNGVRVYDDYAHHPTEIAAMLAGARTVAGSGRVIAVHQPHLYSRTQHLYREFANVLEAGADYTVVLPLDPAREDPVPGVSGRLVSNAFADPRKVSYCDSWEAGCALLSELAQPGDLLVTMSGGNVYQIIPQLLAALEKAESLPA